MCFSFFVTPFSILCEEEVEYSYSENGCTGANHNQGTDTILKKPMLYRKYTLGPQICRDEGQNGCNN